MFGPSIKSDARTHTRWKGIICSLALLASACEAPSTEHVRWVPLEEEDVRRALEHPTGEISGEVPPELIAELEQLLPGLIETARFIGHIAQVIVELDEGNQGDGEDLEGSEAPPAEEGESWGTSLYLKIACPGDTLTPPFEFTNGEVRLDSGELQSLDMASLLSGGVFLLSFNQCQVGDVTIDAAIPGLYVVDLSDLGLELPPTDPDYPALGLALDIQAGAEESPVGVVGFACGSTTTTCQDDVRVAAELDAGEAGTYVASFRVTTDLWLGAVSVALTIDAKNGSSACTFTAPTSVASATTVSLTCDSVIE